MKTKVLTAFLFLSQLIVVTAQEPEKAKAKATGYISLNGGFGIPLGDFSDISLGGGYSGGCFHLNYSTPLFNSHFGITTMIDMGVYEMSASPFISQQKGLMNSLGFIEKVDYTFKPVSYGSYSQTNVMTGLYITHPMKKFSIDARILGGVNFTSRPESIIDFDFIAGSYQARYYENASSSSSFAYDFGFSVRYNMGKKQKICLMLSFDFIGANGDFSFSSKRLYDDGMGNIDDVDIQNIQTNYSVSTYNMTLGFGYVFGKKEKK